MIPESDLGRGLDAFKPETKVDPGYVTSVSNWLPSHSGSLIRRTGYQRVTGGLPVRVERITRVGTVLTLHVDSALSTANFPTTSTPILVYARVIRYTSAVSSIGSYETASPPTTYPYREFTVTSATTISVDTAAAGATDTFQQDVLSNSTALVGIEAWIWGIPSTWWVANPAVTRTTWVTALTGYRTQLADSIVCTWLSNVYYQATAADLGPFTSLLSAVPVLPCPPAAARVIGPAFYSVTPSPLPTRGHLVSPLAPLGWLPVVSVEWDGNTRYTTYVLDATGLTVVGTLDGVLRPGVDYLTVQQSSWSVLDGSHRIVSTDRVTDPTKLRVVCVNVGNALPDGGKDDLFGPGSQACCITDTVQFNPVSPPGPRAHPGDELTVDGITPTDWDVVDVVSSFLVLVSGVVDPISIPLNAVIRLSRITAVLPLTSGQGQAIVRGDVVYLSGYDRPFRVVNAVYRSGAIEPTASVVSSLGTATATISAPVALLPGDAVALWNVGPELSGWHTVTAVNSSTQFEFASAATTTAPVVGTLQVNTIGIDEAVRIQTGTTLDLPTRWAVATAPDTPQKRAAPSLSVHYSLPLGGVADATLPQLCITGGSVYTANYSDPVQKFDGAQVYAAGLARWNPLIGLEVHQNSSALIQNPAPDVSITVDATGLTATAATTSDAEQFAALDVVVVSTTTQPRRVETARIKSVNTTTRVITFTTRLRINTGAVYQLYHQMQFRYYFRYVCRDRNGTASASPAVSSQDALVSMGPPSTVTMKLALYPMHTPIPFYSVELEIYREQVVDGAGKGDFRRLTVIPVTYSFNTPFPTGFPLLSIGRPFELFEDTNQLGSFGVGANDPFQAVAGPNSIGATWEGPPRALTATSMGGRLLLGGVQGYPEMQLAVRESPTQTPSAFTAANAHGTTLVFRRNGTTEAGIGRPNTQAYELVHIPLAPNQKANCYVVGDDTKPNLYYFVDAVTGTIPPTATAGYWMYAFQPRVDNISASQGLDFAGWFQLTDDAFLDAGVVYYPFVFPERARYVCPAASVVVASSTFDSGTPHGLTTGSPLILVSRLDVPPTTTTDPILNGRQFYAIVVTTTTFRIARTLAAALTGTNLVLTSQGVGNHIFVPHYAFAQLVSAPETSRYTVLLSSNFHSIAAVPVPVYDDADTLQITGTYGVAEYTRATSVLLQLAISQLTRAITSVHAGTVEAIGLRGVSPPTLPTIIPNNWLSADSGFEYPFGTAYIRAPRPDEFTLDIYGSIDAAGRDRLLWYIGDTKVVNLAWQPGDVSTTDSTITYLSHGLRPGQKVRLLNPGSGTPPGGLVVATLYYVIVVSNNQFALATTPNNAIFHSPIPLSSVGTGVTILHVETGSTTPAYPSRVCRSYPFYPEIFDGPLLDPSALGSSAAIDVNPDDGQSIRAIIPFYAESYTTAAQQENRLVVFKQRDVYMVNAETREVQLIQSMGHGAEFPRAVCWTKDGIMFADRDGVYKINRQSQWVYLGEALGRYWKQELASRSVEPDVPVAIQNQQTQLAVLAMPDSESTSNTRVLTYDYTREEGGGRGAWSTHTGYTTTAYAVRDGVTHHGDVAGLVHETRASGDPSDFRDDAASYTSTVQLRPVDFGQMGARKQLKTVSIQFRRTTGAPVDAVRVSAAIDGRLEFLEAGAPILQYTTPDTGLSDRTQTSIYTLQFTVPQRKAEYFQLQIEVDGLDEGVEIVQVTYNVDPLSDRGVTESANARNINGSAV